MKKEKLAIKAMTIEGFGRFQEPTRIEFAPVTFLIGPNGAGKSTLGRVLGILRRAFGDMEGPEVYMEEGTGFKVWFEFAEAIAPRGVELGLKVENTNGRIHLESYSLRFGGTSVISFEIARKLRESRELSIHDFYAEFAAQTCSNSLTITFCELLASDKPNHDNSLLMKVGDFRTLGGEEELASEAFGFGNYRNLTVKIHQLNSAKHLIDKANLQESPNLKRFLCLDLIEIDDYDLINTLSLTSFVSRTRLTDAYSNQRAQDAIHMRAIQPMIELKDFLNDYSASPHDLDRCWLQHLSEISCRELYDFDGKDYQESNVVGYIKSLCRVYEDIGSEQLSILSSNWHCIAALESIAQDLKDITEHLSFSFDSIAPFKLSQRVQYDWIGAKANPATANIAAFCDDHIESQIKGKPLSSSESKFNKLISSKFNVSGIYHRIDKLPYNYLSARLHSGKEVPITLIGSGYVSLLCTYATLLDDADTKPSLSNQEEKGLIGGGLTIPTSYGTRGGPKNIGVVGIKTSHIEEIEATLHPQMQSEMFEILIEPFLHSVMQGFVLPPADNENDPTHWSNNLPESSSDPTEMCSGDITQKTPRGETFSRPTYIRLRNQQQNAATLPYADFHSRCLIFETHSEYIIRTALKLVAQGELTPDQVAINYIHAPATQPEGEPPAYHIPIRSNGTLSREFGPGFFDEAQRLKLELIELNRVQANQAN